MDTSKVTRFELIDHIPCRDCEGKGYGPADGGAPKMCSTCNGLGVPGRSVVFWSAHAELGFSLQDDGRTLKAFITERSENQDES